MPKLVQPSAESEVALVPYYPSGAALALMRCRDSEVLIEGPAGTGKSMAVLHKVDALARKYAGCRILIVRKTRASMTESVLVTFEDKVLIDNPEDYPAEVRSVGRRNRHEYHYPNGSEVVVRGLDDVNFIMSTDFDVIAAFEATELTEGDWEQLTTRLRNGKMPYQQALADCNPDRPSHWLNQRASRPYEVPKGMEGYLPAPRPGQTQMTRLLSRHKDNPMLWDQHKGGWTQQGAAYIAKLQALGGARYHRLFEGRWAASEGLVYPGFDPLVHVIDRFDVPKDWRRIRAIDFGFSNPFVCLWIAIDPDGRMYVYREIYHAQRLVSDHARQILTLSGSERYEVTLSDHDAEDRATLNRAGVKTQRAYKSVSPGIQACTERLRMGADGKARFFYLRDSLVERDEALAESGQPTSMVEEFDGYVYPKTVDNKEKKEEPVKLNDHALDAWRYATAHIDEVARKRFKLRGGRVGAAA